MHTENLLMPLRAGAGCRMFFQSGCLDWYPQRIEKDV